MKAITNTIIRLLAPNCRQVYLEAFGNADAILSAYEINTTGLRLCHFMAQILHESGGFTVFEENLNYSAVRMMEVWKKRFPTLASAEPYAHKPRELANRVYNGRMGNAVGSDDGWNFRGRGLMQITGRYSYKHYGDKLGVNLIGDPTLAYSAAWCLKIAAEEWVESKCTPAADNDDIVTVTRLINGGQTGIKERRDWLVKTKKVWL